MAKRPVFDFKLGETPRVREKQEWLDVAIDSRALGAAPLGNAHVLSLDRLEAGPWQVRRDFHDGKMAELVESVRGQGVLEPILVRAAGEGRYQIIAGERRYRAAQEAGLDTIPALILEVDDTRAHVISLVENIQRDDLNEIERAQGLVAIKQLTGQTWDEVARLLGITRRHVLHLVSLTRLPSSVQELVRGGELSAKHGRLLAYVKDADAQVALADMAAELHLNALQTAEVVKRLGGEPGFTGRPGESPERFRRVRDGVERVIASVLEPDGRGSEGTDLLEALAQLRRALATFSPEAVSAPLAERLAAEVPSLIGELQSLLDHLPRE